MNPKTTNPCLPTHPSVDAPWTRRCTVPASHRLCGPHAHNGANTRYSVQRRGCAEKPTSDKNFYDRAGRLSTCFVPSIETTHAEALEQSAHFLGRIPTAREPRFQDERKPENTDGAPDTGLNGTSARAILQRMDETVRRRMKNSCKEADHAIRTRASVIENRQHATT